MQQFRIVAICSNVVPKDVIFRYSYILYIYTYAVFLPKSTLVCGSLQGLNTKYVIMLEPDNTVPLGIIMDHLALFSSEFED